MTSLSGHDVGFVLVAALPHQPPKFGAFIAQQPTPCGIPSVMSSSYREMSKNVLTRAIADGVRYTQNAAPHLACYVHPRKPTLQTATRYSSQHK